MLHQIKLREYEQVQFPKIDTERSHSVGLCPKPEIGIQIQMKTDA